MAKKGEEKACSPSPLTFLLYIHFFSCTKTKQNKKKTLNHSLNITL